MIQSFKDRPTRQLFENHAPRRLPADLLKRARFLLKQLHAAIRLEDLSVPPGNRLHALHGRRKGQHAVRINDQWRLVFTWIDGNAFDVEITDYHDE